MCASVLPGEYCVLRMGASDWMFAGKSTFMVELMVRNQFVDFTSFSCLGGLRDNGSGNTAESGDTG